MLVESELWYQTSRVENVSLRRYGPIYTVLLCAKINENNALTLD